MWDPDAIVHGVASQDIWPTLLARHDALYALLGPPILHISRAITVTNPSAEDLYRCRARGNQDELAIVCRVMAYASSGTQDLTLTTGAGSDTVTVDSGALRAYHLVAPASSGGLTACMLSADGASSVVQIVSVSFYLLTVPFASRAAAASGALPAPPATADTAIASEYAARLLNGPGLIARDRPACVFGHAGRVAASISRAYGLADPRLWGAEGTSGVASVTMVGRGWVPRISELGRRLVIDVYWSRSSAGTGELRLGSLPAMEVTAEGWTTFVREAPPNGGELRGTVRLAGTDSGRFETIQVWRMQET